MKLSFIRNNILTDAYIKGTDTFTSIERDLLLNGNASNKKLLYALTESYTAPKIIYGKSYTSNIPQKNMVSTHTILVPDDGTIRINYKISDKKTELPINNDEFTFVFCDSFGKVSFAKPEISPFRNSPGNFSITLSSGFYILYVFFCKKQSTFSNSSRMHLYFSFWKGKQKATDPLTKDMFHFVKKEDDKVTISVSDNDMKLKLLSSKETVNFLYNACLSFDLQFTIDFTSYIPEIRAYAKKLKSQKELSFSINDSVKDLLIQYASNYI